MPAFSEVYPNKHFFLHKRKKIPFFAFKLDHFITNTFLHMLQTLKLNSKKSENAEKQSLVGSTSDLSYGKNLQA